MITDELLKHATFVRRLALRLTGDVHRAEDVAQEAWLAAAQRPPTRKKALRGWLRVVVKNLVAKQANDLGRRETQMSPTTMESIPSESFRTTGDRQLLSIMVSEVLRLPEPYQTLILQRYYEGKTVPQVAEQVGSTPAQVRHRIDRGLEMLRDSLTSSLGDSHSDWRRSLALACGIGTEFTKTKTTMGIGLVMAKAKTLTSTLVILLVCAVSFFGWRALGEEKAAILDEASRSIEVGESREPRRMEEEKPQNLLSSQEKEIGTELPDVALQDEGDLTLEFVWAVDGSPAADIEVSVASESRGIDHRSKRIASDAEGLVHLAMTSDSALLIRTPRFPTQVLKKIEAGTSGRIRVEIPIGIDAKGKVVDQLGQGVAGADILITASNSFASTKAIATSGLDGSFFLRQVSPRSFIAARHRDFAASDLLKPPASVNSEVLIPLTLALKSDWGSISGQVVGPQDQPIVGALVKAGCREWKNQTDATGTNRYPAPARVVYTGDDGTFDTGPLRAGPIDLIVAAKDLNFALEARKISLAPSVREQMMIKLSASPILRGALKDGEGHPLANVVIGSTDFFDVDVGAIRRSNAVSDANGRYELKGLPIGMVNVFARQNNDSQEFGTLELRAGEVHEWSPVFSIGARIFGRLLDAKGRSLPSWTVRGDDGPRWRRRTRTDRLGRFELTQCPPGRKLRVTFSHSYCSAGLPALTRMVEAGPNELVVKMEEKETPMSFVVGRIVDSKRNCPPAVSMKLGVRASESMQGFSRIEADGSFRIGPLAKGIYKLQINATGFGKKFLDVIDLGAKETKDLGTIRFENPAHLTLDFDYPDGVPSGTAYVNVLFHGELVERSAVEGQEHTSFPLAPGRYRVSLSCWKSSVVESTQEIILRAGELKRLQIRVEKR